MLAALLIVLSQAAAPPRPGVRAHHCLVYDESRKQVVLLGGSTPVGNGFTFYDDLWGFDGERWNPLGKTGRPLSGMRLVFHPESGGLVAFGGFTPDNKSIGELRECVAGAWMTLDAASDKAAAEAGFAYDTKRQRFVLFGGSAGRETRGTTWEWDGKAWQKFDVPGPAARSAHGMVFDSRRGKVVLFGGSGGGGPKPTTFGDTWSWDGKSWSEVEGPGPSARVAPGMAYDSKIGVTFLFGGGGPDGTLGDTWEFDGKKWVEHVVGGPPARISPAMAYDAQRDRIVLFGGRKGWPDDLADTWLFDGNVWKEVAALSSGSGHTR